MDLLGQLEGTWHIVATTFPMWLSGKRTSPTFTYARRGDALEDDVAFQSGGRTKHIRGIDTPTGPTSFEWRGNGLLKVLSSRWQVTHLADDRSCAIITFDKTLFTPAGVDVISRSAAPDDAMWRAIDEELARQGNAGVQRLTPNAVREPS
ncbi:hypothetical protein JNB_02305 [Janibacter sp. HTCC2649]|uniref:hypothetical protein n=1 Tax=Janibacter sp. HTCC2649 TaxID=313589 RepID=UPI000066EA4A|nr:hypothetical protein [Janibacter sp. HTCC2649]EAP98963.1 hypothetical protein JNB_02305 [Janibacter sp. HTCC2649]